MPARPQIEQPATSASSPAPSPIRYVRALPVAPPSGSAPSPDLAPSGHSRASAPTCLSSARLDRRPEAGLPARTRHPSTARLRPAARRRTPHPRRPRATPAGCYTWQPPLVDPANPSSKACYERLTGTAGVKPHKIPPSSPSCASTSACSPHCSSQDRLWQLRAARPASWRPPHEHAHPRTSTSSATSGQTRLNRLSGTSPPEMPLTRQHGSFALT